jgi:hypothetical protein
MSRRATVRETVKAVITVVVFVLMLSACSYAEHHYTREDCTVVAVAEDVVTAEDRQGYVWEYTVEGSAPEVGSTVDLVMYTSLTDSYIYDDEVVGVR